MKSSHYDVIVIGAGMAGLVCSARLAREGKKVLLLEQHTRVGGYCTNFKRKGYEFDAAIHLIVGCEPGGILYEILRDCGAQDYVNFIKLDPKMYKAVFPDRTLEIPSTVEAYVDMLSRDFPAEKKGIRKLFRGMDRIYDYLMLMSDKKAPLRKKAAASVFGVRDALFILSHLNMTFGKYLDKHIRDRRLREIISQLWAFLGVPPDNLSMLFFTMMFMGYLKEGSFYIEGGAQRLSDAFARAFKENGGMLRTGADAQRIIVENNEAKGVEVYFKRRKTTEVFTADAVVSCSDPTHTFFDLVGKEHLPMEFTSGIEAMRPSMSAFCVYLGVEMDLPEELKDDFDIFISNSWNSEQSFEKLRKGGGFDALAISIYSNIHPPFSPEPGKKHVITLTVLQDLNEPRMKDLWAVEDLSRRGAKYRKIKEEIADQLIEMAGEHLPGLSESIEVKSIATPVTMKRYTRNLNGAIVGWENSLSHSIFNRMQQRTPVRNLYTASAWTFPGGGVNGATMGGCEAAHRIIKNRRLPAVKGIRPRDALLDMVYSSF